MPQTRSQHKRLVQTAASVMKAIDFSRFTTEEAIKEFVQRAHANPDIALALSFLAINLNIPYSQRLLHDTFRLVPHLTDLILILHPSTPHTILNSVTFPNLALFKMDLPHGYIVVFLAAHPSLQLVDLGPRGKARKCALASVDLSRLHDIRCPVECFMAIIHLGFTRIRADLTYERTSTSIVLRSFPIPHTSVYILSLHFWPDDMDILTSIVAFAPMIRTLRLWEKRPHTGSEPHATRPWGTVTKWRNTLLKLDKLDQFVLRTTASFVSNPRLEQERKVIFRWIGENTVTLRHPRLRFVAVWYRAERLGAGILSSWSKQSGEWEGQSVQSPTEGHMGIFF